MASATPPPIDYNTLYSTEVANRYGGDENKAAHAGAAAVANRLSREPHSPKELGVRIAGSHYDEYRTKWSSLSDREKYEALTEHKNFLTPLDPPEIQVGSGSSLTGQAIGRPFFHDIRRPFFQSAGRPLFGSTGGLLRKAKKRGEEHEHEHKHEHEPELSMKDYADAVLRKMLAEHKGAQH